MIYNTNAKRDYLIALAIFHSRYVSLFRQLSTYPTDLTELQGASGNLSARRVIARLCDRLDAADQCFSDLDEGSIQADTCDADSPDTHGTVSYEMLTWPEVYSELRRLTQDLLTHAVAADTQRRAGDPRYRK
ncbi:MAG: hypothetical protein IH587_04670, partial [Anaerolineae bacterium]|nr:hypothetical protein [Anaerolineae bacterium]